MIRSALPLRQNELARRSTREIPRDMGAKPPRKTKKKLIAHELRAVEGGTLLAAMSLPAGEPFLWDAPVVNERMPGVGEVELYLDGKLAARGTWPNLKPVEA